MAYQISIDDEIIVDNFAGGGGASTGIEQALGRPVDIAINHDKAAIAMHRANHRFTEHYCESVWDVNPVELCRGRKVALMWLSPDCKHFSKAKGGKPVEKHIRGLAWIALRWAAVVQVQVAKIIQGQNLGHWTEVRALLNTYAGYALKDDEILLFRIGDAWWFIYDIGMRMLTPRELYRAQGFPEDYAIEFDVDGKPYSKKEQIARCGNAVCPPMAEAVVRANFPEYAVKKPITTMKELEKAMVA